MIILEQIAEIECLLLRLQWAERKTIRRNGTPLSVKVAIDWDKPDCIRLISWGVRVLQEINLEPALLARIQNERDKDKQWSYICWYLPPAALNALQRRLNEELQKAGEQLLLVA